MKLIEKHDTRYIIADALESVMQTKPLCKISISDIMNKSSLSRQTFYRYFIDIYDLVNWLHSERNKLSFSIFEENKDVKESFAISFRMMLRYKNFYKYISMLDGPNAFSAFFCNQIFNACKVHIGETRLNSEILFSIKLYSIGATKIIIDWVQDQMDIPSDILAEYLFASMPHNLMQFYIKGR
jgi:Transcriptional regulator